MAVLQADIPTLTPQTGKGVLDEWIAMIGSGENTTELVTSLESLKTQLESNPDPKAMEEALMNLATQTREFGTTLGAEGDISTRLEALSSALRTLAGQLGNA